MTENPWVYFKMATAPTSNSCQKAHSFCPRGHEMEGCKTRDQEEGYFCKPCAEYAFQPNENRVNDRCRLRKVCSKPFMKTYSYGSTVKDAECACNAGYHFENVDQRACVPNKVCSRGFGQGNYGQCEDCQKKSMWSDASDRIQKCQPLRNCEKESRCTTKESDGTFNNKCGLVVSDVSNCDSIVHDQNGTGSGRLGAAVIGGIVVGVLVLLIILIVLLCVVKRRREKSRAEKRMTKEELDEMLQEVVKRSRKDENYCRKVLTLAQREVEDRIDRQIWRLPQELFRQHIEPAKYEVTVEKYKGHQHKFAINGYMQDWRSWRGDTSEAVEELVRCLQHIEREDIVYEIVNKLREDHPTVFEGYSGATKRSSKPSSFERFWMHLFPCGGSSSGNTKNTYESKETSSKLLEAQVAQPPPPPEGMTYNVTSDSTIPPNVAGEVYRSRQTPSAPVIEPAEFYPDGTQIPKHFYDRSDSVPVQASS